MPAAYLPRTALLLALLAPAPAFAQSPTDPQSLARTQAQEGLKLYGAERWQEAYKSFHEADALFHAPSLTLYVARCQGRLGKLLDARATYEQILAEDLPKDAPPAFVSAHVDAGKELAALKPRVPSIRVVVTGVPAGAARVTLAGAPLPDEKKDVDPGSYTLAVQAPGAAPVTREITLAEGAHETITFDLQPPAAVPVAVAPPEAGARWAIPGGVVLGVGALGLGLGAVTGLLSLSKVSDIKARCPTPFCPSERADGSAARTLGNVSTAGFVLGGAGVAAGTVLLLVLRPGERRRDARAGLQARLGAGRIDVEGRF